EKMEAWGKNLDSHEARRNALEKQNKAMEKANEKRMEANEKRMEAYGKRMEAWGEAYGKKMEAWANELEKNYENGDGNYSKTVTKTPNGTSIVNQGNSSGNTNSKAKKTLIIRLPKNAKTEINVRHGQLK